jgi:hypothetical protein
MTARSRWSGNHARLLWIVIGLVVLVTFLVDAAGWFPGNWLPTP